eukprot:TRINITY_DN15211_c0_g2_i3.p2 TRINITY_DN15211_c0_g2~~TRINITY_DN15211_c0_g2_i3.p2  ORF type:complete len:223 (-),score=-22.74 TRINITY_DN15211_c0_g2_i3:253-921(-)
MCNYYLQKIRKQLIIVIVIIKTHYFFAFIKQEFSVIIFIKLCINQFVQQYVIMSPLQRKQKVYQYFKQTKILQQNRIITIRKKFGKNQHIDELVQHLGLINDLFVNSFYFKQPKYNRFKKQKQYSKNKICTKKKYVQQLLFNTYTRSLVESHNNIAHRNTLKNINFSFISLQSISKFFVYLQLNKIMVFHLFLYNLTLNFLSIQKKQNNGTFYLHVPLFFQS